MFKNAEEPSEALGEDLEDGLCHDVSAVFGTHWNSWSMASLSMWLTGITRGSHEPVSQWPRPLLVRQIRALVALQSPLLCSLDLWLVQ